MKYYLRIVVVCLTFILINLASLVAISEDSPQVLENTIEEVINPNTASSFFETISLESMESPILGDQELVSLAQSGEIQIPVLDTDSNITTDTGTNTNTGTDTPITGTNPSSGDVSTGITQTGNTPLPPISTGLQIGDIIISEVFPSSGNCLDEFVKLHFNVPYQGMLEIYGLGTSTASVKVKVDVISGSDLIIADNIAGMIPNENILLVSTVTLTNGGELLKVLVSGNVLDQVRYSGLQGTQSLVYTQMSGAERLFTTNIPGSPATTCHTLANPTQITGGLNQCDIKLSQMNYLGTGLYKLSFHAVGQSLTGCQSAHQLSGEWLANGISQSLNNCKLDLDGQLGANIIEFKLYDVQGNISCYDQFIFANNYDVGVVKQYVNNTSSSISTGDLCEIPPFVNYEQFDCGLQFQGSKLGFFAGYKFNLVSIFNNKQLSNTQKTYKCLIDMGDGTILEQCNPPSYLYQFPGVYNVSLDIIDINMGQLVCKTRTFINAPLKNVDEIDSYAHRYSLNMKLANYCAGIHLDNTDTYFDEEQELTCNPQSAIDLCASLQSTGYINDFVPTIESTNPTCETGLNLLGLYSVVPNPSGSDSEFEQFTVFNSGENILSDMSNYSVHIGSKTIVLSGSISGRSYKTFTGGRSLVNKGMCITLSHESCGALEKKCYDSVKENEEVIFSLVGSGDSEQDPIKKDKKSKSNIVKLNNKITAPQFKPSAKTSTELSCTEKIKIAKQKEKVKYDKLKLARASDKLKHKTSLALLTIKERIARNNRYLYENTNKLNLQNLKSKRPGVLEQGPISFIVDIAKHLESLISSGYVYTHKDSKKHSYKYLNAISSYVKQKEKISAVDILSPEIGDYLNSLNRYSINAQTIDTLKK